MSQVFRSHTHSIVVKFSSPRPRIGLVTEGPPPVPLGFIHCEVGIPLPDVHREIERQLPLLHSALVATGYTLLDDNGWPISASQEQFLSLVDVLSHMTLTLRLHPPSDVAKATTAGPSQLSIMPGPAHSRSDSTHSARGSAQLAVEYADVAELSFLNQSMSSYTSNTPGQTTLINSWITDTYRLFLVHLCVNETKFSLSYALKTGIAPYEILISYVHKEASDEAVSLREALQVAGYRVFLDVECIRSGSDWQDVLNDAVSNCSVFVPLITQQYGQVRDKTHTVELSMRDCMYC